MVSQEVVSWEELKRGPITADVVVVLNFGGWGNVPLNQAEDLMPTVRGVSDYLKEEGLNLVVVPYRRAPVYSGDPGATTRALTTAPVYIAEILGLHRTTSRRFAAAIETLALRNPGPVFLLLGLSLGSLFVDRVMVFLSPEVEKRVFAIELGAPFWHGRCHSENILHIDNGGADPLTTGDLGIMMGSLFAGMAKFIFANLSSDEGRLEKFWRIPAHEYSWLQIKPAVTAFLKSRLLNP